MMGGRASGYSLLETLVVLAIFALMVAGLAPFFRSAVTLSERSEVLSQDAEARRALNAVLAAIVARAVPPTANSAREQDERIRIEAADNRLSFVAPLPDALGGGLARYELRVDRDGAFLLQWTALADDGAQGQVALANNLDRAEFTYLVAESGRRGATSWKHAVSDSDGPIKAVKLTLVPKGSAAEPEESVISMQIDRNVWCVFDPVALECRPGG